MLIKTKIAIGAYLTAAFEYNFLTSICLVK